MYIFDTAAFDILAISLYKKIKKDINSARYYVRHVVQKVKYISVMRAENISMCELLFD